MTAQALPSIYKTKFVAFVDLLGFSDIIKRSGDDLALQAQVAEVVDVFQRTACENEHHDIRLTAFSDSLVLSASVTESGLNTLLGMIGMIARNLLIQHDVLLRGGLSIGSIHHEGAVTYGPAMLDAYAVESKWAVFPAVVLSDEVALKAAEYASPLVQPDPHRPHMMMLDYLSPFRRYNGVVSPGEPKLDGPARIVVSHIQKRLIEHREDPSRYFKAKWVEAYWNSAVRENGVLPEASHSVSVTTAYPTDERTFMATLGDARVEVVVAGQSLDPGDRRDQD